MLSDKAKYVIAVVIYGTVGMVLHYISVPSEVAVLCRGTLGTLTILVVFLLQRKKINLEAIRRNRKILLLSGVCLGLNWIFLFAAYRATTVAIASLCNYMAPIIVIALTPFLFRERLTWKKRLCILLAFTGIVMVSGVLEGDLSDFNLTGVSLGLAAALAFVGVVLCNRNFTEIDPLEKTMVQLAVSAVVVFPYVLFQQHGHSLSLDVRSVLLLLVLGIVHTGLAYIFYFTAMGSIPVQSVAILGYLEPVVAVLTSALVLREPITLIGIAGAALVLGAAVYSELP